MGQLKTFVYSLAIFSLLILSEGKKVKEKSTIPCPEEVGCIECKCDSTGFNSCKALKDCPGPAKMSDVKEKADDACPYGPTFKAECTVCECTGEGDHCAMCFALPVKRSTQPDDVNKKLPWLQDSRILNYEINGWLPSEPF